MGGYIIADLVRPDLSIVNIVIFIGEMDVDDVVDFFLDEGTDVIEDCFFLFGHMELLNQLLYLDGITLVVIIDDQR